MKKYFKAVNFLPFLGILLWTSSCIEPFDAQFKIENSILVVDGNLTDQPGDNYVNLRKSVPSSSSNSYFFDIDDAIVEIIKDDVELFPLHHFDEGIYHFPEGFLAEAGHSYQLKFTLSDGKVYTSNTQNLKTVSPIENVYQRYQEDGLDYYSKNVPGHKIYIDTKDPVGKGDAYYWTWSLYEFQRYCKSCAGGRYFPEIIGDGCVGDFNLAAENITFDYQCDGDCWEIIHSDQLNAMNDAFIDGRNLNGLLVADIPYYTKNGAILEIRQHSITDQAYKYLKLLIDQNQNSGSLTDTPSSALVGNIKNEIDPTEAIGGFFVVSSVSTYSYFVDRSDVPKQERPIGFYLNRLTNPEPAGNDTSRPPLAPCLEGRNRTKIAPDNWNFQ